MSSLTDEQRKMIEANRKAAQAKLAAKLALKSTPQQTMSNNNQCTLSKTGLVVSPSPNEKSVRMNYNHSLQNSKSKQVRGTCEIISKERFTVHVTYHQQLIDTFKTISSKNYGMLNMYNTILHRYSILNTKKFIFLDPKTSEWSFLIKDYDQLMISIKPLEPNVKIEKLPHFILKVLNLFMKCYLYQCN